MCTATRPTTCRCWNRSAIPLPPIPAPSCARWRKSAVGRYLIYSRTCRTQSPKIRYMLKETIKNFVGRLFSSHARGPERLSRDKHGIDRRNVPRHAIKVCEVLRYEGFDANIVGAAGRDLK